MKMGRNREATGKTRVGRPALNQAKKSSLAIILILITAGIIFWVMQMGQKAERTVPVAMLSQNVYKNQVITEDMFKQYDMLEAEYEKYALVNSSGATQRRILLWDERSKVINGFAAYPLMANTYAEYRNFIKSRIDNNDNALYSFPGKFLTPLEIEGADLEAFKTYLMPGDRLTIEAVYVQSVQTEETNEYGDKINKTIDVFKTETVFGDIMVADIKNSSGDSVLDIYANYRNLPVWDQAKMDASTTFKQSTQAKTLVVALTPEEKERYYYFLSKKEIKFKASLPQRID